MSPWGGKNIFQCCKPHWNFICGSKLRNSPRHFLNSFHLLIIWNGLTIWNRTQCEVWFAEMEWIRCVSLAAFCPALPKWVLGDRFPRNTTRFWGPNHSSVHPKHLNLLKQHSKHCYVSQRLESFPQPAMVILPRSASTLSLHPLVARNDSDCSGPQEQQKTPNDSNLEVSQMRLLHSTNVDGKSQERWLCSSWSSHQLGHGIGNVSWWNFMRESFECKYTWGITKLEIEMS